MRDNVNFIIIQISRLVLILGGLAFLLFVYLYITQEEHWRHILLAIGSLVLGFLISEVLLHYARRRAQQMMYRTGRPRHMRYFD